MLGHTPQCSGVSTQVLAECTPALAGEGRKNQSLLVPNVLERAEERRSTLEGVSESRTGRGETEASGSPHRLAKGKQRSTPAWTWVRRAPARRSRPTRSAGTSRAQERRGCRATNLVVPGRAVLERPHRWRGEHRDCRDSAVAGERRQRGRAPPARASAASARARRGVWTRPAQVPSKLAPRALKLPGRPTFPATRHRRSNFCTPKGKNRSTQSDFFWLERKKYISYHKAQLSIL